MATLTLTLRTLIETLVNGPVDSVYLKTELGEMEVLPGHATFVGIIGFSRVTVRTGSTQTVYVMRQGSVSVDAEGGIQIVAQDVQEAETLSIDSVRSYLQHIEELMRTQKQLSAYQQKFLEEQRAVLEEALVHADKKTSV